MAKRNKFEIGQRNEHVEIIDFEMSQKIYNNKIRKQRVAIIKCDCGKERKIVAYNFASYYNCGDLECPYRKDQSWRKENFKKASITNKNKSKERKAKQPHNYLYGVEREKGYKYLINKGLATEDNVVRIYNEFKREYMESKEML